MKYYIIKQENGRWKIIGRVNFHPLLLLSLFINAFAIGMFAYENYIEEKMGYSVTFIILCLFLIVLTVYGLVSNSKYNRT